jgi:hypothetical protein
VKVVVPYCVGTPNLTFVEDSVLSLATYTLKSLTLQNTTIIIEGDLILSETSYLEVKVPKTIDVRDCIYLNGTLNVSNIKETSVLLSSRSGCMVGRFETVILPDLQDCQSASLEYKNSTLTILLELGCNPVYIYAGSAVGGFLLLLVSVLIVLYVRVRCFRREISPHGERIAWKSELKFEAPTTYASDPENQIYH